MKRTIIAAAVCGITLSAVACAPSDSADGTDSSAVASVADSTSRPSHIDEAGSSTSATSQTPSESTSAETTASAMPASPTTTADQGAATGGDARPATPSATRSADGRARIGDPCPGLESTLRPAVNGENLICAGEPEPRWTVILDEPSPTETSPDPGDGTTEPGDPSQGDGPTTAPGTDGDGHHGPGGSSSQRPTPEPGRPTR